MKRVQLAKTNVLVLEIAASAIGLGAIVLFIYVRRRPDLHHLISPFRYVLTDPARTSGDASPGTELELAELGTVYSEL
jgi:hypothetical protein